MSLLIRNVSFLLYGIVLLLLAWLGEGVFALVTNDVKPEKQSGVFQKVPVASSLPARASTLDDYVAIKPDRFCGMASEPTVAPRTNTSIRPTGMQAVYILRGTLIHSNPALSRAFIDVPGVSAQQAYHTGEEVQGAKILSIKNSSVALKKGEDVIELAMNIDTVAPGRFRQTPGRDYSNSSRRTSSTNEHEGRRYNRWSSTGGNERKERPADRAARNGRTTEWERERSEKRSNRDSNTYERELQRMPKMFRKLLEEVSEEKRRALMRMNPTERQQEYRRLYMEYKRKQKASK